MIIIDTSRDTTHRRTSTHCITHLHEQIVSGGLVKMGGACFGGEHFGIGIGGIQKGDISGEGLLRTRTIFCERGFVNGMHIDSDMLGLMWIGRRVMLVQLVGICFNTLLPTLEDALTTTGTRVFTTEPDANALTVVRVLAGQHAGALAGLEILETDGADGVFGGEVEDGEWERHIGLGGDFGIATKIGDGGYVMVRGVGEGLECRGWDGGGYCGYERFGRDYIDFPAMKTGLSALFATTLGLLLGECEE